MDDLRKFKKLASGLSPNTSTHGALALTVWRGSMEREAGWDDAAVDSDDSTGGADADIAAALESHAAATRVQHRIEPYLEIGKQLHVRALDLTAGRWTVPSTHALVPPLCPAELAAQRI
jgi:hypothetical protein